MKDFLKQLETAIQEHLKETYLPPHRAKTPGWTYHDLEFFSGGADQLSTALTEEREGLPKNYLNRKEYRSAYLLYFTLINAAKVWHCLNQATPFLRKGELKILDLGIGPGTASLAAASFFHDRPLEIFGLEQNKNIQKDAYGLWHKLVKNPKQKLRIQNTDLHPKLLDKMLRGKRFDIAIAANFLSELPFREQIELSQVILKSSSLFIVIEPALQRVTRQVMQLRDVLVRNQDDFVLAPCLHQKNCPMLAANKRDWCHFYIDWKCPKLIRDVDAIIGNKHDYLKMTYMIFSQTARISPTHDPLIHWRVVSSPLISNGKKEFILCGANGKLQKITRLDKHRSESNLGFDPIRRGAIILAPDKERIEPGDSITLLSQF